MKTRLAAALLVLLVPALRAQQAGPSRKPSAPAEQASSAVRPGETISKEDANTWTYDDAGPMDMRETVREGGFKQFHGKDAFYYETETTFAYSGTTMRTITRMYFSKEKDGIYLLGSESEVSGRTSESVYDPPMFYRPLPLKKGSTWNYAVTGKTTQDTGESGGTTSLQMENEVTGEERVTVPAGTFDCLIVKSKGKSNTSITTQGRAFDTSAQSETTSWVVPGLGDIKTLTNTRILEANGEAWSDEKNQEYSKPLTRTLAAYKLDRSAWGWGMAPPKPGAAKAAPKPGAAEGESKSAAASPVEVSSAPNQKPGAKSARRALNPEELRALDEELLP